MHLSPKYLFCIIAAAITSHSMTFSMEPPHNQKYISYNAPNNDLSRCGICLEPKKLIALSCGKTHQFHTSCIDSWKKINPTCPTCRTPIPAPITEQFVTFLKTSFFKDPNTIALSSMFCFCSITLLCFIDYQKVYTEYTS